MADRREASQLEARGEAAGGSPVNGADGGGPGLRPYAAAFLVATIAALMIDAALQLALDAVRVSAYGGAPWWVTTHLVERGRWVVLAALLWWLGPRLMAADDAPASFPAARERATIWRDVAIAVIAVPVLWILATWAVSAVRFTLLGTWDTDGRVFVSPDYYRGTLLDLTPWLLASAALFAIRRHVD